MSTATVTLHNNLPKAWRPTRIRVRRIEKCLVKHGSCLSFSGCSVGGISKPNERVPRLVFRRRKFTVRLLLFVWETANTGATSVSTTCENSWCVVPSHQRCKV